MIYIYIYIYIYIATEIHPPVELPHGASILWAGPVGPSFVPMALVALSRACEKSAIPSLKTVQDSDRSWVEGFHWVPFSYSKGIF